MTSGSFSGLSELTFAPVCSLRKRRTVLRRLDSPPEPVVATEVNLPGKEPSFHPSAGVLKDVYLDIQY